MAGWVRVHRKMVESQVFQSERLLKVWVWCLLRASHSRRWVSVATGKGKTEVEIMPGQFVYGRKSANKLLRIPQSSISRLLKKLTSIGAIEVKADTHYSIVTICKWDAYQKPTKKKRTPKRRTNGQATDTQRTPNGQATDTNKNVEECIRMNKKDSSSDESPADATEFDFPTVGDGPGFWTLSKSKLAEYVESFPGVNVEVEIRKARQWCRDNPSRRKTVAGMPKFLSAWLGKAQNSSRSPAPTGKKQSALEGWK